MSRRDLYLPCLAVTVFFVTGCDGEGAGVPHRGSAPEFSLQLPAGADDAANAIDEASLRSIVEALSSDEMAGRGPADDGDRAARAYIVDFLASLD